MAPAEILTAAPPTTSCHDLIEQAIQDLQVKVADTAALCQSQSSNADTDLPVSFFVSMLGKQFVTSLKYSVFFLLLITGCGAIGFFSTLLYFRFFEKIVTAALKRWRRYKAGKTERDIRNVVANRNGEKEEVEGNDWSKKKLVLRKEVLDNCGIEVAELEELEMELEGLKRENKTIKEELGRLRGPYPGEEEGEGEGENDLLLLEGEKRRGFNPT